MLAFLDQTTFSGAECGCWKVLEEGCLVLPLAHSCYAQLILDPKPGRLLSPLLTPAAPRKTNINYNFH